MSKREEARRDAATSKRAEQEKHQTSDNSYSQNTTNQSGGQAGTISGLLLHGAENGLHLRDLSQIVGADPRIVRQMIHNERRQGIPILSNSKDG